MSQSIRTAAISVVSSGFARWRPTPPGKCAAVDRPAQANTAAAKDHQVCMTGTAYGLAGQRQAGSLQLKPLEVMQLLLDAAFQILAGPVADPVPLLHQKLAA